MHNWTELKTSIADWILKHSIKEIIYQYII